MSDTPPDDRVRRLVREKLAERDLSYSEVSLRMGRNHAYIHQFLERGVPRNLLEDAREQLAPIIGVKPGDLKLTEPTPAQRNVEDIPRSQRVQVPDDAHTIPMPTDRDLPVYGSARGGQPVMAFNEGVAMDWVARPPALVGIRKAFAVYMVGESMEPRYYAGEVLYIHPGRPVRKGDWVLIDLGDDTALIKRFHHSDSIKVVVEQLNPPEKMSIPSNKIRAVYKVVGAAES